MTISEAVTQAMAIDGFITIPKLYGYLKIKPTNGEAHCILMQWDGSKPTKHGWQPPARDLMRDDWMVIAGNQSPSQ